MASQKIDERELKRLLQDEAMRLPDMGIVVSGLSGRFPKSNSMSEFEENLYNGIDMINDDDNSRFTCGLWGLPPRAGRLKDLSRFDCEFFGFTAEEANYIDYQMRLLYEVVYESILDAGINPTSLRGTNTGVFFGLHCNEFENAMGDDPNFKNNGYYAQFAVKVAQYFDLRGLTITFDAACASGFVGLHNAVQALNDGIIDQAIVCSANIPIHPTGNFIFLQMQMLSPTGYSRFLDSRADGYVKSEACVSMLLQRKDVAFRNYVSFLSTMTNVDGYKSEGITFPSDTSQESLIRSAKELAGISTNHIEYLEAHGTGTPAGDPQEARAISSVYYPSSNDSETMEQSNEDKRQIGPLLVGSVKTNMGHSEATSGLCSLVKAALMLENEIIYKGLHYAQPNSNIESLMDGRLKFVENNVTLNAKIIPLSCYGFGGANVHAIVRANHKPAIESGELDEIEDGIPRLITMFGRTKENLDSFFDQILNTDSRATKNCLSNDFLALMNSINSGPIDRMMEYRGYLVVNRGAKSNNKELVRAIKRCQLTPVRNSYDNQLVDFGRVAHVQDCAQRPLNLFFNGFGCQWPEMAKGLRGYRQFWSTIERLSIILEPFRCDVDLVSLLTDDHSFETMAEIFVSIVAYQIALTNMIKNQLKVKNLSKVIGHSLGEISCAYASGLLSEREAILVAYHMGKTLDINKHLIEGKMIALDLNETEALEKIAGYKTLRVSCVNGPISVTISGSNEDIDRFCASIQEENNSIFVKQLDISIALHNEVIMGPEIERLLKEALLKILFPLAEYKINTSFWISSTSPDATNANAEYFATSLCKKVDLLSALNHLAEDSIVLELGPTGLFESQLIQVETNEEKSSKSKFHYVKMMKQSTLPDEQPLILTQSIGELYQVGAMLDLTYFYHGSDFEFPVRRQVPSLSSMFQWDHQHSLFVPRYPIQFGKSSAKSEMPVDIMHDRDKFIVGHCIEGRVLYPATGYLFLIWRVFSFTKRKIHDACFHAVEHELMPVEFHNVRLMRAIILANRVAQIYIHYEEGTGRFEIKEGGSVVVEGYARSPIEKPNELLYEDVKQQIRNENLELILTPDDIYKQFRVSGYDYGESFRNIESASADGRYCKIKFNGHFAALTDSILQTIFLAVTQYAPSGGLFLPTRFDYVRFQPEQILRKIRQAKMPFDLGDRALDTEAKREIMTKIMQRKSNGEEVDLSEELKKANEESAAREKEVRDERLECIFDTYCDPITGIIITDGIEMRGIKATPAPRRSDTNNEVLLESYQFVTDEESPVNDENLTQFKHTIEPYTQICDSMSIELLSKLSGKPVENLSELTNTGKAACKNLITKKEDIEAYKTKYLKSMYKTRASKSEKHDYEDHHYDIKKNGDRMLLSVLDQLCGCGDNGFKEVKELVQKHRQLLMRDLIQSPLSGERFMRPLIEIVLENTCVKKAKIRMLEVNVDDGLMKEPLQHLIQSIAPTITLDYSLAHPDPTRISSHKALTGSQTRTYKFKDLHSLFNDHQLSGLDLVVYKDISCYSLPKQVIEQNGLAPVLSSLNNADRSGGFIMVVMRQSLTLAERILLALCEPELVGLSKKDLDKFGASNGKGANLKAADKIDHINSILASRCKQMLKEAESNKMICLSQKSDLNGCTVLLFKTTLINLELEEANSMVNIERVLLRVMHNDQENIDKWLLRLKEIYKPLEKTGNDESNTDEKQVEIQVWLCAIATKQNPISGLIGMMQALGKELGWARLRCYYDCHTFKDQNEPIDVEQIEMCAKFQESLTRNVNWNCIDSNGKFGSFRHFTINDYLNYENCLCSNGSPEQPEVDDSTYGFVNNATRGDLSSFTWYEAPYKYLSEQEKGNLVRVAYSALNFRDIMLATGRLPLDAIPLRLAMSDCLLGLEFSGYDSQGRRVAGMTHGRGIGTHALCPNDGAIRMEIPDWMSLREAATIPVVYATAIMALIYRGRMKRGETILIHAGSGGVGQAAIRLAAHYGLEIFATVGTAEKRQFLLEQFPNIILDDHLFSSRNCDFETEIMKATGGRGVDLVLNSLADDKLQASIRCLADGGRFLEIGKYDLTVDTKLELLQLDDNKTFHGILLDKLFDTDDMRPAFAKQMKCVMETLKDGIEKGYIKPIQHTTFKRNQIEEAFRFMATGKHMGKVLIEIDGNLERDSSSTMKSLQQPMNFAPRCQFSPQKSYIITGGLGGFGLELTKWLVHQGVRHIILTSRTGIKSGYQRATINRLIENNGANIEVIRSEQADACSQKGAEHLLKLACDLSPTKQVGGIFHLAMVLKDTLLENMSSEDFKLVCGPKVDAGFELDKASRKFNLDYFVCFSSITSGKGNAGQSNYAYANSCLERLCERRRELGQHGLAIQWGAIGDVGVAFENLGGNNVIVGGTIPQRIPSCLSTLAKLLASPFAICLSVVPANRGGSGGAGDKKDLVGAVMHVLGIKDPSKVGEQATLGELGLDSLMAVEIRQYIEREYEMTLNIQEIRSLTIAKIRDISENGKPATATTTNTTTSTSADNDSNNGQGSSASTSVADNSPTIVESYGTKHNSSQSSTSTSTSTSNTAAAINGVDKLFALTSKQQAYSPTINKNSMGSFVPELTLPKEDFIRLNFKQTGNALINGTKTETGNGSNYKRPIFFLPPIHGRFDHLESVCAHIDRPCIGLQWTRKLGRVQTVAEAVEIHLDLLKRTNWRGEFALPSSTTSIISGDDDANEKVVDLVGYSFGATIAFELMLAIQKLEKTLISNGNGQSLKAGQLILLDGSPKQLELSSEIMDFMSRRSKTLSLAEKVDEMLMYYVIAHTKGMSVDYIGLQRQLTRANLEDKIKLASERLANLLKIKNSAKEGKEGKQEEEEEEEDKQVELAYAMEAFCRRYELMKNYKVKWSLPNDCTLIRAEKIHLQNANQSMKEDLDLSSVVKGKVSLHIMSGDHESFLELNQLEIGEIIANSCSV